VESLGLTIQRETPKELRGACAIHGGDNVTSFRFNKEKGTWVCFSHKCHEIFGNDVVGLVKAAQKVEFMDAVKYLSSLVGDFDTDLRAAEYRREKERKEFMGYTKKDVYIPSKVTEEYLNDYKPLRSTYFNSEGFTNETLNYFEVAGGYKSALDNLIRDVIPIRNTEGKLVAYSLRDIRPDADDESKYILTPGFDKDNVLYNLHRIVPVDKPIIVVEGFKSVWRLWSYGIETVVAVMGSKVTQGQRSLLYSHALHGVVIFFDNDEPGVLGTVDAFESLKSKIDVSSVFITEVDENGKGLDPADLDQETVYGYLKGWI
jgi:DNA primase